MVLATLGMALSAAVGELAANRPWVLLVLVTFWAFCYGMSSAISSPASWVGQQCCIFLVVSSAVPGTPHEAALRAAGVLTGGFLQFLCILLLWHFFPPARSTYSEPGIHTPGWQRRAIVENLTFRSSTFRYALLLALTGLVSQGIAQLLHFHNAYWIPMTALIIMKPDLLLTNVRSIARLGGTFVGAALATLVAMTLAPGRNLAQRAHRPLDVSGICAAECELRALRCSADQLYRLYPGVRPNAGGQYGGCIVCWRRLSPERSPC